MKNYNIGILGATGVVGREMMKILSERGFPTGEIRLFASEKSAGKKLSFGGETIAVEAATKNCFSGLDIVFGAVSSDMAKTFAPHITASGAVFIDNSSAFRQNPDVPLVVPEINPSDALSHNGIIANPNCSTIITLVAVNALCRISPIKYIIASTYQAVSGAGAGGITELYDQQRSLLSGDPTFCRVFPHRIAENLIPHRDFSSGRLHNRGNENAKRGQKNTSSARPSRYLHLRKSACCTISFDIGVRIYGR